MARLTWSDIVIRRLDITKGADPAAVARAKAAALLHPNPVLPAIDYTEDEWRWVLLYDHARVGQVKPARIRRMRRDDLEFLAGMTQPHPEMPEDEAAKLLGNVSRARSELERRRTVRTAILAAAIGALASLVGVAVTLIWK